MFIINVTYKVDLAKIDQHLADHIEYLNKQYALGHFIASGRKVPRTGGIILSTVESKLKLVDILNDDPFKKHDVADYDLIEFVPSKASEELKFLLEG